MKKLKTRITWGFNPVTRVVKSKKIYDRQKKKLEMRKNIY
jgi:hypothetical protein